MVDWLDLISSFGGQPSAPRETGSLKAADLAYSTLKLASLAPLGVHSRALEEAVNRRLLAERLDVLVRRRSLKPADDLKKRVGFRSLTGAVSFERELFQQVARVVRSQSHGRDAG